MLDKFELFKQRIIRTVDDKNVPGQNVLVSDLQLQVRNFIGTQWRMNDHMIQSI